MIKKIKNIFYIVSLLIFIILVVVFYFSDTNINATNKSRSLHAIKNDKILSNLIVLENDTDDVIIYKTDVDFYKKNKKIYKFWDLIKK